MGRSDVHHPGVSGDLLGVRDDVRSVSHPDEHLHSGDGEASSLDELWDRRLRTGRGEEEERVVLESSGVR